MKQTERRSLFGKTYPLLCFRCKHRIPHLPKAKSKGVPNQPFYRNLIKEIKKPADIPMMTALQRRHSRNSFQTRRPIEPSLVTFLPAFSKNTKEPHHGSSALSHLFRYLSESPPNSHLDGMHNGLFYLHDTIDGNTAKIKAFL